MNKLNQITAATKKGLLVLCQHSGQIAVLTTASLSVFAGGFLLGQWTNDTVVPPKPSYEDVKAYTDGLIDSEEEADQRRVAQIFARIMPEPVRIEVPSCPTGGFVEEYTEPCDCEVDYNYGYEAGREDGLGEGWKSCETVTSDKVSPKGEMLRPKNYRNSRENTDWKN